jgi:hypothetical protein
MVKRFAPVGVIVFCLLATCGTLCQSERPSSDVPPDVQSQQMPVSKSLPDAPLVQPSTQAKGFAAYVDQVRKPPTLGTVGVTSDSIRLTGWGHIASIPQVSFTAPSKAQTKSSNFMVKYLYPSVLKQRVRYQPSGSGSFVNRAAYAASRIFITRDEIGRGRLNTAYVLGALTSVAIQTAHRPYWSRSPSSPFNDFGSTIGGDAGISLLHEFGPGIRQIVRVHEPKFVSKTQLRITHDQNPKEVVSTHAR